jgi:hypothetical protein
LIGIFRVYFLCVRRIEIELLEPLAHSLGLTGSARSFLLVQGIAVTLHAPEVSPKGVYHE